jgi:hypothetical protein
LALFLVSNKFPWPLSLFLNHPTQSHLPQTIHIF